jgi:hypothetical protein
MRYAGSKEAIPCRLAARRTSRLVVLDLQGVRALGLYPPDWAAELDIAADGVRGKAHPAALVACARKLLIFANTVVARGTPWT